MKVTVEELIARHSNVMVLCTRAIVEALDSNPNAARIGIQLVDAAYEEAQDLLQMALAEQQPQAQEDKT